MARKTETNTDSMSTHTDKQGNVKGYTYKTSKTTTKSRGGSRFGLFSSIFGKAKDKKGFDGNMFFWFFLVIFFLLLFANVYQMIFDTGDGQPRTLASLLSYFENLHETNVLQIFSSIDITISGDWGVLEVLRVFLNNFLLGPLQILLVFVQGVFQLIAYVLGFLGWLIM